MTECIDQDSFDMPYRNSLEKELDKKYFKYLFYYSS